MPPNSPRVPIASPAAALFPLRIFLGVTFVYAGIQKLSDPGFLHPGAPTYIGTQLAGFAHGTPGGFLLRAFALPDPKLAGVGVALIEIAVGLMTIAGLTRGAAAVGLGLNLVLFLTNSWHTYPYFLGSDIVFVFAWLPIALAGARGQPAVDNALGRWAERGAPWRSLRSRWEDDVARARGEGVPVRAVRGGGPPLTRRGVLAQALGLTAFGAVAIGGLSALAKGSYRPAARSLAGGPSRSRSRTSAKSSGRAANHPAAQKRSPPKPKVPPGAVLIGSSSQLPSGQAATYTDPVDGQTAIAVREPDGGVRAFSAVCTHAGCTVGYSGGQLVCPCHGGVYDARTGAVLSGPPPSGLARKKVVERGGSIYALRS